ncbi:unnamed protein product, partial [Ceratitis capitata]
TAMSARDEKILACLREVDSENSDIDDVQEFSEFSEHEGKRQLARRSSRNG